MDTNNVTYICLKICKECKYVNDFDMCITRDRKFCTQRYISSVLKGYTYDVCPGSGVSACHFFLERRLYGFK